jgi:hypothetical protein
MFGLPLTDPVIGTVFSAAIDILFWKLSIASGGRHRAITGWPTRQALEDNSLPPVSGFLLYPYRPCGGRRCGGFDAWFAPPW